MKSGKTTQSQSTEHKRPRRAAADAPAKPRRRPQRQLAPKEPATVPAASPEERRMLIARIAYFRAEARGFAPGRELDDWFAAEAEVDAAFVESR